MQEPQNPADATPISQSKGSAPLPVPDGANPIGGGPQGSEATGTEASTVDRAITDLTPDDKDIDGQLGGPHGTPANTWNTNASDEEADVDGSLDASRTNPQGVDGVRSTDS